MKYTTLPFLLLMSVLQSQLFAMQYQTIPAMPYAKTISPSIDALFAHDNVGEVEFTALMLAAAYGFDETVGVLLERAMDYYSYRFGIHAHMHSYPEWNALMLAAENRHPKIVKRLLDAGAEITIDHIFRLPKLFEAACNKDADAEAILEMLFNSLIGDSNHRGLIRQLGEHDSSFWRMKNGASMIKALDALVRLGYRITSDDFEGKTLLMHVVLCACNPTNYSHPDRMSAYRDLVKFLIGAGADPKQKDNTHTNVFMILAKTVTSPDERREQCVNIHKEIFTIVTTAIHNKNFAAIKAHSTP